MICRAARGRAASTSSTRCSSSPTLVNFWNLLVMSVLSGVAFSFNMPARQAAMPNLVPAPPADERHVAELERDERARASSRRRSAGLLIAPIGIGGGFAVLTALYILSAVLTLGLPKMPPKDRRHQGHVLRGLSRRLLVHQGRQARPRAAAARHHPDDLRDAVPDAASRVRQGRLGRRADGPRRSCRRWPASAA